MQRWLTPTITLTAILLYWLSIAALQHAPAVQRHEPPAAIVLTEPLQVLLYAGDRFLAADIEAIRATTSSTDANARDFRLRAHLAASRLNPCHEDNYWVGNASLSWGGSQEQGFELLRNAMHCRVWDEWPAFFYGFNEHFFRDNLKEAQRGLEIAAKRSHANAAAFRTFSIMLAAGKINDIHIAMKMLQDERDKAKDPKLKEMLAKRVVRLQGLQTLRNAQATYEKRYSKPLTNPQDLLNTGILKNYPDDPLKIGYQFQGNAFHLRQLNPE